MKIHIGYNKGLTTVGAFTGEISVILIGLYTNINKDDTVVVGPV